MASEWTGNVTKNMVLHRAPLIITAAIIIIIIAPLPLYLGLQFGYSGKEKERKIPSKADFESYLLVHWEKSGL